MSGRPKRTKPGGDGGIDARLADFLVRFRAVLAEEWVPGASGNCTLAQYLASSPTGHNGDEQSVVDALTRRLLGVLGWEEGTGFLYNAAEWDGSRPDFLVRVPGRVDRTPAFIVEDKSTAIRNLRERIRRRLEEEPESPLEQLRRYVTGTRSTGRIGLLCNGWTLQGWIFTPDGPIQLLHLDFAVLDLADRAVPAEDWDVFPVRDIATLWGRFSRDAFADAEETEASLRLPPPPADVLARIREAMREPDNLAAFRAAFLDWYEDAWRAEAIDVAGSPEDTERLVDSLRALIGRFSADVRHQLDRALLHGGAYEEIVRKEEARDEISRAWSRIVAARPRTDMSAEEFEALCMEPLGSFRRSPALHDRFVVVAEVVGNFAGRLRRPEAARAEQHALPLGGDPGGGAYRADAGAATRLWKREMKTLFEADAQAFVDAVWRSFHAGREAEAEYGHARRTADAYTTWRRRVSASVLVEARNGSHARGGVGPQDEEVAREEMLKDEFSRQTAYVYVVRLLLVRICEDKGLFARKLSNGALVEWEEQATRYLDFASGRSYEYLTAMACECAQNVYAHLFGSSKLFDWYQMDGKMLLFALAELNRFNLARIDADIIGTVYGRYLVEGKHDQGRYYTPPGVVRCMLDLAGWTRHAAIGRRLLDPSCGSGSFLVEAARRVIDQYRGPDGVVPTSNVAAAIQEVKAAAWGIDLNPFACYLAETNLLIQVLDLIRQARVADIDIVVDRFHVYCDDSLMVNEPLAVSGDLALLIQRAEDQAIPELIKARAASFRRGFDVVVGNPPYVRADAKAPRWLAYRAEVQRQDWPDWPGEDLRPGEKLLRLKWDLYVPFVKQSWRLLSDEPSARACLITIKSIETAPYAVRLRKFLASEARLHDVVFTTGLKLFDDARWQDNVIVSFSRGTPQPGDTARRWVSEQLDEAKTPILREMDTPEIRATSPERLLNRKEEVELDLAGTVPWEELCYLTVGMVLNSDEKLGEGQELSVPIAYDERMTGETVVRVGPREKVIRHRPFGREELLSGTKDARHPRPFVGSAEVLRGGIGRTRWLEYGLATRCPSFVRRPTFPELYDRPKVMFGAFTGVAVDAGEGDGFLCTNHSVRLAIRWSLLRELDTSTLRTERRRLGDRYRPAVSEDVSDWYLCAVALSAPIQARLRASNRAMKDDVFPNDIRRIPVKLLLPAEQQPFVDLARELHALHARRIDLEDQGFSSSPSGVVLPVWLLVRRFLEQDASIRTLTLFQATGAGLLQIEADWLSRDLRRVRSFGEQLVVGAQVVGRAGDAVVQRDRLAALFAELLAALPAPLADRQALDRVPGSEEGLLALATFLDAERMRLPEVDDRMAAIQQEIDRRAWSLYRPKDAPNSEGEQA